jgi:hypothetical protein
LLTLKISKMRTKFFMLGAVGLLAVGVGIHHSGHCPLMSAKAALTKHASNAPASVAAAKPAADAAASVSGSASAGIEAAQ